jgi:hypothetical protein
MENGLRIWGWADNPQPETGIGAFFVRHYLGGSSGSAIDAARRAGSPWPEQMARKMLRNVEKRGVHAAGNAPSEDRKCWQGVELCIHGLRSWGCNLSRKVRATPSSSLCSAHLARITRCKFLQPLRYLCQFMYLTTVKRVLRNSFDVNYLRKMCGTWVQVQAARLPLEPGEAEKRAAFLFRSPRRCFVPPRGDKTAIDVSDKSPE